LMTGMSQTEKYLNKLDNRLELWDYLTRLKDLFQTIKQHLSQEAQVLLLVLLWVPLRLLLRLEKNLSKGNQVSLKLNGKRIVSVQLAVGRQNAGRTAKAENTASDAFTELKQGNLTSYSQAEKPASSARKAQQRADAEQEGDIK
jgi:hypothetical protein